MLPFQAHGPVSRTPSRDGIRLGVPNDPSPRVSANRPVVCPSAWQLLQENQPSCDSRAS